MDADLRRRISPGRSRSGFTLIELLVVIAIIALLVAILMPTLNEAKDMARTIACMTRLDNLGIANDTYASEYGGFWAVLIAKSRAWGGTGGKWSCWAPREGILAPYIGDRKAIHSAYEVGSYPDDWDAVADDLGVCPAYEFRREERRDERRNMPMVSNSGGFPTAELSGNENWVVSYGVNPWLQDATSIADCQGKSSNREHWPNRVPKKEQWQRPQMLVVMQEAKKWGSVGPRASYLNPNHADRAPTLYGDGHVEALNESQLVAEPGHLWSPNCSKPLPFYTYGAWNSPQCGSSP